MNTRVRKIYLPGLATLALLLGGTAMFAQNEANKKPEPAAKTATATITDTEFAQKAAAANMAEVKLGQLAEQKGTTDTVKDFGKRMVTDHSTAEETQERGHKRQDYLADSLGPEGPGCLRSTLQALRGGFRSCLRSGHGARS